MKRSGRVLAVLVVLLLLAGALWAGGQKEQALRIGMVNPLTGDAATYGLMTKNGMDLAIQEINGQGGVGGKMLELVTYDDQGNPTQAAAGAQKFADDPAIMVLVGSSLSSSTLSMVPISKKAGLPHMVVSSSSPKLSGSSPTFFRMAVQDAQVGPAMGELVTRDLGLKKVAIMYPNNDYGKGLGEATAKSVEAGGGQVLANLPYMATDKDFSALLDQIAARKPEALALCGTYTDTALIVKQARESGKLDVPYVGGTGANSPKFIEIAQSAANGFVLLGVFLPTNPDPQVQSFTKAYQAKFGGENPDHYAGLAYDMTYVIADAARRASEKGALTRASMAEALRTTNLERMTGTVQFNADGDWVRPYLYITVKDGKFSVYDQ